MTDHLELLKQQLPVYTQISSAPAEIGFFGQEVLRFYSLAGTLGETFELTNSSIEERQITHVIARSLLENFFWLIYIFDKKGERTARFNQKIIGFKREYGKLLDDPSLQHKDQLEPAGAEWSALAKPLDVKSMLDQVRNANGDRLGYLYFAYRVSSFDTHGNTLSVIFEQVFGKPCSFSALDLKFGFDLMANHYLVILGELVDAGEI